MKCSGTVIRFPIPVQRRNEYDTTDSCFRKSKQRSKRENSHGGHCAYQAHHQSYGDQSAPSRLALPGIRFSHSRLPRIRHHSFFFCLPYCHSSKLSHPVRHPGNPVVCCQYRAFHPVYTQTQEHRTSRECLYHETV